MKGSIKKNSSTKRLYVFTVLIIFQRLVGMAGISLPDNGMQIYYELIHDDILSLFKILFLLRFFDFKTMAALQVLQSERICHQNH
jgi:hypothetical protein